ncbi:MAG: hypothetical protein Q9161_004611 [Pseudevernia consocians]
MKFLSLQSHVGTSQIIVAVLDETFTALNNAMPCSTRYVNWNNTFCALILLSHPIAGTGFVPRDIAAGEAIARRTSCDPAAPDVSESSIIADVCNQTLANDTSCSDQMWALQSAAPAS